MIIAVGDRLPEVTLVKVTAEGPDRVSTTDYFAGRKVALFAVPGAFTPTCSAKHLPGFAAKVQAFRDKLVDEIACTSVNDAFVLSAWAKVNDVQDVTMLADGNGDFAKAIGLTMDGSAFGMGLRSQRYSMLVEDGVVTRLNVEEPGDFKVSSAEHLLDLIGATETVSSSLRAQRSNPGPAQDALDCFATLAMTDDRVPYPSRQS